MRGYFGPQMRGVFYVFIAYVVFILGTLAYFTVIGLTHH
jgi:hypothetical protein